MTKLFIGILVRKICEKLNPLTPSSSGAISLKTTLEKCIMVKRVHSDWDSNLWTSVYKTGNKSDALSLSSMPKKFIAKHLAREYQDRTTPPRFFLPCNLSSCIVYAVIVPSCNAGSKILEKLRKQKLMLGCEIINHVKPMVWFLCPDNLLILLVWWYIYIPRGRRGIQTPVVRSRTRPSNH